MNTEPPAQVKRKRKSLRSVDTIKKEALESLPVLSNEEALLRQTQQLERINAELESFAWTAAHDLKEPIRTMATYAHLVAEECGPNASEDLKEMLRFMIDAAQRATERIEDILTYSSLNTQNSPLHRSDMTKLVRKVLRDLDGTIKDKVAIIDVAEMPTMSVSPSAMMVLFQNLIENALKFCEGNRPFIDIYCEQVDGEYIFCVKDNGIGIEDEFYEKIFQMFQRLNPDRFPGTGIGLAICRKVVELHDGRIWVESRLGEGSTFKFSIPMDDEVVVKD